MGYMVVCCTLSTHSHDSFGIWLAHISYISPPPQFISIGNPQVGTYLGDGLHGCVLHSLTIPLELYPTCPHFLHFLYFTLPPIYQYWHPKVGTYLGDGLHGNVALSQDSFGIWLAHISYISTPPPIWLSVLAPTLVMGYMVVCCTVSWFLWNCIRFAHISYISLSY